MISFIEPQEFSGLTSDFPLIDVRAPGEYAQGHLSGAFNIPLYDDEERALIGTLYVKTGRDQAVIKGLDIALPKINGYLSSIKKISGSKTVLMYCWRGGLRSANMAEVFNMAGYDVLVLKGGYKACRSFIRNELSKPQPVVILGGYTGSGKTTLLKILAENGEQIIDLEALANHKGSVFGALGQLAQPTNEQFENEFFSKWNCLDPGRPVWMEDESRMIGRVTLPDPLVETISQAAMVRINVEKSTRICHLVEEYSKFDKPLLTAAIQRISQRMGGERTSLALKALEKNDFSIVAEIALSYYDKAYQFAVDHRKGKAIQEISITGEIITQVAEMVIEAGKTIIRNESHIS
jgi:tRNA 2-selenouridine synthase